MTITYNGFKPGESRTVKVPPHKVDKGHSIVELTRTRQGSRFEFHYAVVCECGVKFTSKQSMERCSYSYSAHLRAEGVK